MVPEVHSQSFWFKGPGRRWPVFGGCWFSRTLPQLFLTSVRKPPGLWGVLFFLYINAVWPLHTKDCGENGPLCALVITVRWPSTMCNLSFYFRKTEWVDAEINTKLEHFGKYAIDKVFPNQNATKARFHWAEPQRTIGICLVAWTMGTSQREEILPSGHCRYIGTSLNHSTSSAINTNIHMTQC